MKIVQIFLFTFSTVSIIHCSQQPDKNEESNAGYHIEFEDKSANGGYGYKVHVSGKSKYQETWKNEKKLVPTSSPIATGTLDYSQNNYATSTNNFVPKVEPITESVENNLAEDSKPVTATNQYSSKLSSQNNVSYKSNQISKAPNVSNNIVSQTEPTVTTGQKQHFEKILTQASANSFTSHDKQESESELQASLQNSIYSQNYNLNKSPVQYASSDNVVPINFHESKISQNKYNSQNYESSDEDWKASSGPSFVSSSYYSNKPSVQIMNQYSDNFNYNFDRPSHIGPEIFVESTSGKINHNQFINSFESKPQEPKNYLSSEADLSNYYLQNPKILYKNSVTSTVAPQTEIPPQIEYYQPVSNSKEHCDYQTLSYANQYASQIPSAPLTQSAYIPETHSNENTNYYNSINYATQYESPISSVPVNQYSTIDGITYSRDSIAQKPIQYSPQISTVPSTQFVTEQEIKQTKDNTIHKSINSASQYQSVPFTQYPPVSEDGYYTENNIYKPSVSTNQYTSVPLTQFAPQAQENIYYNPSTLTSQYVSDVPPVPLTQYASQETTQYVPQQNIPSFQEKPSVQLPIDYNQFLRQYPQLSQEHLASVEREPKEIPQHHFYNAFQEPIANKQVVSYHYKQEFPSTSSKINHSPSTQYIMLNSFTPKDLASTYNTILNRQHQHPLTGLENSDNGVPPHGLYGNVESGKNNQNLYAPGLTYGYGSNDANDQELLNVNEYTDIGTNGSPGDLYFEYNNQRRRYSEKEEEDKKYVADQRQTE